MITKLLNEINKKIETLNDLVQNKEYFKQLEEHIDKINNHTKKTEEENKRLNNIIDELEKDFAKYHKYQNRLKWYEEDYIEFIEILENKLKEKE